MKTQNKGGRKQGDKGTKNGAAGRRRANNSGTLEKRGNKWRARWTSYTPEGNPIRMTKTLAATSLAEARKELNDLTGAGGLMSEARDLERIQTRLGGIRAELDRIEDAKPALALADMFAEYERSPDRSQRSGSDTMRQYEMQLGRFIAWMSAHYPETTEMRQVTKDIATAFLADFGQGISANTYNKYVAILRNVWQTLGEKARCTVNPWEGVKRKEQSTENGRRALTVEELTRVCSTLTGEMRVLFALGIYTGLRLGDCALLDWGKIDIVRRLIVTKPHKTKKHNTVVEIPIHPALYSILDETPSDERTGYLLPQTAETYLRDTSAVAAKIRRVFEAAGFKTREQIDGYKNAVVKVGFHSLRHTFVSLMGNAGAPLALVQSIVGHSNERMTQHYFHAQTAALANAVGQLPTITTGDAETAQTPAVVDVEATVVVDGSASRLSALDAAIRAIVDSGNEAEIAAARERLSTLG